jgi:hypothetical protein
MKCLALHLITSQVAPNHRIIESQTKLNALSYVVCHTIPPPQHDNPPPSLVRREGRTTVAIPHTRTHTHTHTHTARDSMAVYPVRDSCNFIFLKAKSLCQREESASKGKLTKYYAGTFSLTLSLPPSRAKKIKHISIKNLFNCLWQ